MQNQPINPDLLAEWLRATACCQQAASSLVASLLPQPVQGLEKSCKVV